MQKKNFSVQPHPHCAVPHFRTVRKKCGRMVPNFYKSDVKLRNKICDLQIKFSGYLHYKSAPPNANGGASEKAPSIGQTSHEGPINIKYLHMIFCFLCNNKKKYQYFLNCQSEKAGKSYHKGIRARRIDVFLLGRA